MIRFAFLLVLLAGLVGCDIRIDDIGAPERQLPAARESPSIGLPLPLIEPNWLGPNHEGSCCHATLISLLRWQGRPNTATWWRQVHGGGEFPESLHAKLDAAGIRYATTVGQNDVAFLRWALDTRRGALVTVHGGQHAVMLAHLDNRSACLFDNNDPERPIWLPAETFLAEWSASNSWALAPVYGPSPPLSNP